MAKDKLTDYDSTTPSNNTDIGGISVAEGMLPSAVNNSIRELTKQLGAFADGTDGIDVLSLADDDASHAIKLQAPASVTATTTFTLPDGDGASGQAMITDGAGTLSWAAPYGNRNLIINGAMQVAQRGDQSSLTSGYTGVDRFTFTRTGAAAVTGKQAGASDSPQSNGFGASLEIDITTADSSLDAGDFALVRQIIEGQNLQGLKYGTSSAENVALSFWVKSPKTGTHIVELYHYDGNVFNSQAYTVNSANTWEHKTLSFVGYQTTATANDNTQGMLVQWWLSAGSDYSGGTLASNTWHTTNANRAVGQVNVTDSTSNNFYLTGVQLEVGDTATPFEHRSYGDELRRCQRYYYAHADGRRGMSEGIGIGTYYSASAIYVGIHPPVTMRATPSLETTNATNHYFAFRDSAADHFDTFSISGGKTPDYFELEGTGNVAGTAGQGCFLRLGGTSSSARIMFDAEL